MENYTEAQEVLFNKMFDEYIKTETHIHSQEDVVKADNSAVLALLIKSFDEFVLEDEFNLQILSQENAFEEIAKIFARKIEKHLQDIFEEALMEYLGIEEEINE